MKMKKCLAAVVEKIVLSVLLPLSVSCEMLGPSDSSGEDGKGELRIAFAGTSSSVRSVLEIPDTSDFLLKVTGPGGKVIYDGVYGDSPESIMVDAGSYTVNVISCEFSKPAFSQPQFGDEQCVVVPSGGVADVKLTCVQMNAGIVLDIDESFLEECPDGVLFLKSAQGRLMYSYMEKRTAYFKPGSISLLLSENGVEKVLMTKILYAQDILRVNVSAASSSSGQKESISIAVDTTRNWIVEDYVIGGTSGKGKEKDDALTVSQAIASAGAEDVWVNGYIVGGDLTASSASFDSPFLSRTNILLGSRSSTSEKDACLSVQLPSGNLRDMLNLVDNPELLGRKLCIKGDIVEAYYGIPGIKNVSDFDLL